MKPKNNVPGLYALHHQFFGKLYFRVVGLNPDFTVGFNVEVDDDIKEKLTVVSPSDTG